MNGLLSVYKKELRSYFLTPVAYLFISVFLFTAGASTFYLGGFYERGRADLEPFFAWHPWLFLFLIPAVSMRLWSEEARSGTIELLIALPVPLWQIVTGKFLAAWSFISLCLILTGTIWITAEYLGNPDNGIILATYAGSLLMAGCYLSIGSCISAMTRNQVTAFVITLLVCILFTVTGFPLVTAFLESLLPQTLTELISSFSLLANFQQISLGILEVGSIVYMLSLVVLLLFLNTLILNYKRCV